MKKYPPHYKVPAGIEKAIAEGNIADDAAKTAKTATDASKVTNTASKAGNWSKLGGWATKATGYTKGVVGLGAAAGVVSFVADGLSGNLKKDSGTIGTSIGKAVGIAAGSIIGTALLGPLGGIVGGWIGEKAGKFIGNWFDDKGDRLFRRDMEEGQAFSKVRSQKAFMEGIDSASPEQAVKEIAKSAFNIEMMLRSEFERDENNLNKSEREALEASVESYNKEIKNTKKWAKEEYLYAGNKGIRDYATFGDDMVIPSNGVPTLIQRGNNLFMTNPSDTITASKPDGVLSQMNNPLNNSISIKPINISITGNIQLTGNGQSIDISQLTRDPVMVSSLKDLIIRSINESVGQGKLGSSANQRLGYFSDTGEFAGR
jgi:hypothetical protein